MVRDTSVMPLFSSAAYIQTTQNITISSDSFKVNMVLSPQAYANSDCIYLITNPAHNAEQLGYLTTPIYRILKMQLNEVNKCLDITNFFIQQKTKVETDADFFQHFIKGTDERVSTKQLENAYAEIYWPISTINHNYI